MESNTWPGVDPRIGCCATAAPGSMRTARTMCRTKRMGSSLGCQRLRVIERDSRRRVGGTLLRPSGCDLERLEDPECPPSGVARLDLRQAILRLQTFRPCFRSCRAQWYPSDHHA